MAKRFDKVLERATDPALLEADWELIMACIDSVRSGEVPVKNALNSVKKRFHSDNPHVAHHSLMVLEALVKNCGEKIHKEIATKEFMEDLKHLANDSGDKVKEKILELIQCWSYAFREKSEYKIVNDTHNLMKLEGFSFPPLRESDAMFDAEAAPEWVDANKCYRCRTDFGLFTRKHHCRNCGQIFCDKCSSKYVPLPHIGIENDVRVCETCFDKIRNKSSSSVVASTTKPESKASSASSSENSTPNISSAAKTAEGGKTEDEIREEEELQLALAISQSEADEKERLKQRHLIQKFTTYSISDDVKQPKDKEPVVNGSPSYGSTYSGVMEKSVENDSDGELAKYLNRGYWETRKNDQKRGILRNSPTPSAPVAPSEVEQNSELPVDGNVTGVLNGNSSIPNFTDFVNTLRTQIEIFVNRIRNDQARGRSVVTDSGIQSMFVNLSTLHSQLLQNMSDLDDKRGYYESLQDKLAQIKDAREAVDALRVEHEQRRQAELMELQRQRQIQMAAKLDVMRHKKHEMLEQQRLLMMQKMEEQRREMEMRRQMQFQQQQQMTSMPVGPNVYSSVPYAVIPPNQYPTQQYGPVAAQQYDSYGVAHGHGVAPQQYAQMQAPNMQQGAVGYPPQSPVEQGQYNVGGQQQPMPNVNYSSPSHQPTAYYNQSMGNVPQQQQYGPMVYASHPTAVVPPIQQQQQQQPPFPTYQSQPPVGIATVVPGTIPTNVGSPMHYVHQSYTGPQMTPLPQAQFNPNVNYGDPQAQNVQHNPQVQQQPVEAQLISFD